MNNLDFKISELMDDTPLTVLRHREKNTYTLAVGFPADQEWTDYHVVGHFAHREDALNAIHDKR